MDFRDLMFWKFGICFCVFIIIIIILKSASWADENA